MTAKTYKCPNCNTIYITEEPNPICPSCSNRDTGKVYLEEI